jgi:peptidoglycan/LPS O-acetylase OafA/YrhL
MVEIPKTRHQPIDILRGLCIISVILLHINIRIPFGNSSVGQWLSPTEMKILFWSGYYGVIIFFVISGFLITSTSLKRWGNLQNIKYDQFYMIRFARIMPCLIAVLMILSILDMAHIKGFVINAEHTSLPQALFSALTFHINWLEAKTGYLPSAWDMLWSLSVEEAFYLFFPLICRCVKNEKNFILTMLIFIMLGPFARCVFSKNDIWMDHSYLSCTDGIAMGCLAALFISQVKINFKLYLTFLLMGLIFSLFIIIFRHQAYTLGISKIGLNVTLLELGISFILIALNNNKLKIPWATPFQWFGKNSYEIYLTHMFFVISITQIFYDTHQSYKTITIFYFIILFLSGLSGYLISKYYSEPLNRILRRRLTPSALSPPFPHAQQ